MKILIAVGLLLGLPASMHAAELAIPDNFFRAYVKPDNSVAFGYTRPPDVPAQDQKQAQEDALWWQRCAKHTILLDLNTPYRDAYYAVVNDPQLQTTGITFKAWSAASQDEKVLLRATLQKRALDLIEKHGLRQMLASLPVDEKEITAMATQLRTGKRTPIPLLRYCPGADGNIAVNREDPDFPKLEKLRDDPTTAPKYEKAIADFQTYLEQNPTAPIPQRTEKLNQLIRPLLSEAQ